MSLTSETPASREHAHAGPIRIPTGARVRNNQTPSLSSSQAPQTAPPQCRICRTPLTVHQEVRGGICDQAECRRQYVVRETLRVRREADEALRRSALLLRDRVAKAHGEPAPEKIKLAIVPNFRQAVAKLPRKRRQAFRAHLRSVIREAFNETLLPWSVEALHDQMTSTVSTYEEPAVLGSACAFCEGACCRQAGDRAYITATVIRSFLAFHPGTRPSAVLRAYEDRLPEKSYAGSCVYHGQNGCTLPRSMRPAICNTYFCPGLGAVRADLSTEDHSPVLVVTAEGSRLRHSALLQPSDAGVQTTNTEAMMER